MAERDNTKMIVVRDRREPHQFSVHNRVIDEWLPIIGLTGLGLYALYVRMANRVDERAFPGYTLIRRHLGISRGTISRYNQLLKLCGLIHIESGTRTRPNYYYILDIPQVTSERLAELRKQIAQVRDRPFVRTVLRRIEEWVPIEAHWKARRVRGQEKVIVRRSEVGEGGSPVEHSGFPVEHPGSPVEQGVPPGNWNNPKQQQYPRPRKNRLLLLSDPCYNTSA